MIKKKQVVLKSILSILLILCAIAAAGCTSTPTGNSSLSPIPSNISVTSSITEHPTLGYTIVNITKENFLKEGFFLGDSLDVTYSNGKTYHDIPFVSGTSVRDGTTIVGSLEGSKRILIFQVNGNNLFKETGAHEGDLVTISLNTSGKYLDVEKVNRLIYSSNRSDQQYTSDEQFSNFRVMTDGNLKKNFIYRGSSPIDNSYNRASITDSLLKKAGIKTILDLANTPETISELTNEEGYNSPYFDTLNASGNIIAIGLNTNYRSDDYARKLANGFTKMTTMDGPFYINCLEGKERTGFASILIESLAGASYNEIENDFMKSYDNYYHLTKTSDPNQYEYLKDIKFDDKIRFIAGLDENAETANVDIKSATIKYLKNGGMTDEQIDAFIKKITT